MSSVRSLWPVALFLVPGLLWFPLRFGITQVDSPATDLFGAPLPWRSPSIVFSLHTDVYWGPLLIDAVFWLLVGFGLLHLWKRHAPSNRILNLFGGLVVVIVGLTGALLMAVMIMFGASSRLWYDGGAMTFVSLGMG